MPLVRKKPGCAHLGKTRVIFLGPVCTFKMVRLMLHPSFYFSYLLASKLVCYFYCIRDS